MMSSSDAYTDVVELCALLQCLGFSVKSLESNDGNVSHEGGSRTVVINCQTSGIHVVLESGNMSCSCPTQREQNSGMWEVSGVTGGKQLDKEFGCTLLGSLPKAHRERLTKELQEMIRCIKASNESDVEKMVKEDKSASLTDLKTPEKLLFAIKAETPTRYRSLDTLTASKNVEQPIPAPGPLQRTRLASDGDGSEQAKKQMCRRQSTYTVSSTPGSGRHNRNKTSSPIHSAQSSVLNTLIEAEKSAEELRKKLSVAIRDYLEDGKNDSSISSLALDVSKISVLKATDTPKSQFASSPNLSGISMKSDFTKSRIKRFESASTSNLATKSAKEGKMSRLSRISPNIFKKKENSDCQDGKSKLKSLFKPKAVESSARVVKPVLIPESSPNLSASSRKKYSHIKSTIPRLAKKE